jgi:hypothetical protein
MYEKHHTRPISTGRFALRIIKHAGFSFVIIAVSLLIGIAGYIITEQMPLLDAFLNSAMLLGGMGPVKTDGLRDLVNTDIPVIISSYCNVKTGKLAYEDLCTESKRHYS